MRVALRLLALMLVVGLAVPLLATAEDSVAPIGDSSLAGKIVGSDGRPAQGVKIHAYHLFSQHLYSSPPTDSAGRYELADLPKGYFDIAVETAQGLYVADHVVNVPAQGKAVLSLELNAAEAAGHAEPRHFPGMDQAPIGTASVNEKGSGGFLRGKTGVALLAGGGAIALMAIGGGGGGGGDACGNGVLESGEECDDGNTASGDDCSATCQDENASPFNP